MSLSDQHKFQKRQAQRKHDLKKAEREVQVVMARGGFCRTTAIQIINKGYMLKKKREEAKVRMDDQEELLFSEYLKVLEEMEAWDKDKVNRWKFNVKDDDQKSRVYFYKKVIRIYAS